MPANDPVSKEISPCLIAIAVMSSTFVEAQHENAATATRQAYGAVWGMVQQQAAMLSYNETSRLLAAVFVLMLPLLFLMRKANKGQSCDGTLTETWQANATSVETSLATSRFWTFQTRRVNQFLAVI
jgi:hypothetical protein